MEDISWFHSIPFPDGTITNGAGKYSDLKACADLVFNFDVSGKSVLDIGAWDGFFSFEAEKRGARRVLATDYFCWEILKLKDGFDFAKKKLNSKVEELVIDLPELTIDLVGRFDVVLFLGVLYHLKDPKVQLERLLPLSNDIFVIETLTALNDLDVPAFRYIPSGSINGDVTNHFAPNILALTAMLNDLGYSNVKHSDIPMIHDYDRVVTTINTSRDFRVHNL